MLYRDIYRLAIGVGIVLTVVVAVLAVLRVV
jgi:hypothetical protein